MEGCTSPECFSASLLSKEFWCRNWTGILLRVALLCGALIGIRYFGALFASLLGIALVFLNLGNRTGGVSAYSVFNREGRYLLGDLRLSQIERELRHGGHGPDDGGAIVEMQNPLKIRSRDANKKCPCGSERKAKRCCGK